MSPELKAKFLEMLDEARVEVERGNLESLVVLGRRPATQDHHFCLLVHSHDADLPSLYGFLIIAMLKTVKTEQASDISPTKPQTIRMVN